MSVIVKCIRGSGDVEAPPIGDPVLSTESVAKLRGKRFLDDPEQGAYYTTKRRVMRTPHRGASVKPRTWITVTDSHLGLTLKLLKVKSYSIAITQNSVWATMETEQYDTPS
jgi:hypothetical protein